VKRRKEARKAAEAGEILFLSESLLSIAAIRAPCLHPSAGLLDASQMILKNLRLASGESRWIALSSSARSSSMKRICRQS